MEATCNAALGLSRYEVLYGRKPSFKAIQLAEIRCEKSATYSKLVAESLVKARKLINIS